jgi:hypothetical protein
MPYTRRRRPHRGHRRRAAGSIQKAWRNRKRRKIGLVQRTLMANRQALSRIKKSFTTKVQQDEQALPANDWDGQYNDNLIVDNDGQETSTTTAFSPSLLRLPFGGLGGRVDPWVQMKSLTMKYCITAGARYVNQRVTLMLVLDNDLIGNPSGNIDLGEILDFTGATVAPPSNKYDLAFQNLTTTGHKGRFKILWKKVHMLTTNDVVDTATVPAITQQAAGTVMRPEYDNAQWRSRSYAGRQYGSVTIKRPYKLNYGQSSTTLSPANQTIRLFAFSTAEGALGGAGSVIQYYCRFRFKDL